MAITAYGVSQEANPDASRNVRDMYKNSLTSEIRADLERTRSQAVQVFLNTENDFNVATCIRTHNALNARACYIVGRRRYDHRGTVGTHHYTTVYHADTAEEVFQQLRGEGYTVYAVENNVSGRESQNLWDVTFPEKSVFVYGTENCGIPLEVIDQCDHLVLVEMYGSVRSFNLATCSAIVLAEYSRQHRASR